MELNSVCYQVLVDVLTGGTLSSLYITGPEPQLQMLAGQKTGKTAVRSMSLLSSTQGIQKVVECFHNLTHILFTVFPG